MKDTSSSAVKLLSRHSHLLLPPPTKSARHHLLHRSGKKVQSPAASDHGRIAWIAHNKAAAKLTCRDGILATYTPAAAIGRSYSKH
jgi:hypothetical protein